MERSHVTTFIILVVLAIAAGSIGSIGPLQGSTANVTSVTPGQSGITFAVTTSPSRTAVAVNPQSGRLASTSLPKGAGGYSVTKRAESSVTNQVESPGTYSFHIMSEGVSGCTAINPTTTFLYSDAQAWVLFEATISSSFQVQFYSRDTTSRNWDLYYDSGLTSASAGTYCVGGYIYVSGYWPASNYPRAWMVEVYLDGSAAFLEFFEVTDYNLSNGNVFETATGVDSNNNPINPGQTVFTVGVQSAAYAYLRLNDIAYCSEAGFTACGDTNGHVHTLLAEWYLNGGFYSSYSNFWADYKNTNLDYNFWSYGYDPYDYITIGSSTVGSWVVYLYLDQYYNGGSVWYGPVAEISFTVQAASSTASTSTITTTSTSGATTTTTTSATIFSTQTAYVTTPTTTLTTSTTTSTSAITPFATTTSIVTATVTTPTTSTKTLTSTTSQTLTSSHTTTSYEYDYESVVNFHIHEYTSSNYAEPIGYEDDVDDDDRDRHRRSHEHDHLHIDPFHGYVDKYDYYLHREDDYADGYDHGWDSILNKYEFNYDVQHDDGFWDCDGFSDRYVHPIRDQDNSDAA